MLEVWGAWDCSGPHQKIRPCVVVQARQEVSIPMYLAFSICSLLGKTRGSQMLKESFKPS